MVSSDAGSPGCPRQNLDSCKMVVYVCMRACVRACVHVYLVYFSCLILLVEQQGHLVHEKLVLFIFSSSCIITSGVEKTEGIRLTQVHLENLITMDLMVVVFIYIIHYSVSVNKEY